MLLAEIEINLEPQFLFDFPIINWIYNERANKTINIWAIVDIYLSEYFSRAQLTMSPAVRPPS